jgi:oligopeptidase A
MLPKFSQINPSQIVSELSARLDHNRERLTDLLAQPVLNFETLVHPLDDLSDHLHQFWALVNHLNSVMNSDPLREAYNACLPLLSAYYTEISHNQALYRAFEHIRATEYKQLNPSQQKIIDNELRDFKLSGVALNDADKKRFADLSLELTKLSTQFEENLLDATNAFSLHITDKTRLRGLPESALNQAHERAKQRQLDGYLINLEAPSYIAVMTYAEDRTLRETIYRAYVTRASEFSEAKWDNTHVMQQIMQKRLELAQLLGFENYAQKSLATKMANSPEQVLQFLNELVDAAGSKAQTEMSQLKEFAKTHLGLDELAAHDVAFASEKLREREYDFSEESLRPYFAAHHVIQGLFLIIKKLFGVTLKEVPDADVWHPDVRCYALYDEQNQLRSYCYVDLYARQHKRGGAWMDDCQIRRKRRDGSIQLPIAFVTCNFNGPTENTPALFTHDEVITLFHEFGHALQHMLTTVDYAPVSGIQGVPWDAVEIASQFLENWAWQKEALDLFAVHYQSGETLPNDLFNKMQRAQYFQAAMHLVRQLEFSLFDFILHLEFDPKQEAQIESILTRVRQAVSVVPIPAFNRFAHGFSHIFAGGYAAGYYSYKWAEVMAADAFSLFLENGIFDLNTSMRFLHTLLESGGSRDPMDLFIEYRGRAPSVQALLAQTGIAGVTGN